MAHRRAHLIRLGTVALASVAALGAAGGVAGAAATTGAAAAGNSGSSGAPDTLAGIKAKAASDVTARVNALNAGIAKVNAAKGLGPGQAALAAYLGADITPLQQLNQKIAGDTTVKQAAEDFSTIFSNFRVYLLVLPAARIAGDADHATTTALPALTADAAKAQSHVDPGNQAQLQPLIDDLNSQISTATDATNGLAATVLAFTPAQWDANHDLLSASKSAAQTTDAAVTKGRADVRQIVQILKGSVTAGHGATATGAGGASGALHGGGLRGQLGTTTSSSTPTSSTS